MSHGDSVRIRNTILGIGALLAALFIAMTVLLAVYGPGNGAGKLPANCTSSCASDGETGNDLPGPTPDVLIIGSGPAGLTAAYKLATGGVRVRVCEAGRSVLEEQPSTNPLNATYLSYPPLFNQYNANLGEPFSNIISYPALSLRKIPSGAGRTVGGGSSMNGMQLTWGTCRYWDSVCAQLNASQWCCAAVRARSKQLEGVWSQPFALNTAVRGQTGPLSVRASTANGDFTDLFLNSATPNFFPFNPAQSRIDDYNDPASPLGPFVNWQVTQRYEPTKYPPILRESAHSAYLGAGAGFLEIIPNCTATSLVLDQVAGVPTAKGANVVINGIGHVLRATKRVIISAGVQSANLLQYSGIGDAGNLQSVGVPVRVNNANVGAHLRTHPAVAVLGVPYLPCPTNLTCAASVASGGAGVSGWSIGHLDAEKIAAAIAELTPPSDVSSASYSSICPCTYQTSPTWDPLVLYTGGVFAPSPVRAMTEPTRRIYELLAGQGTHPILGPFMQMAALYLDSKSEGSTRITSRDGLTMPDLRFSYLDNAPGSLEVPEMIFMAQAALQTVAGMGLVPIDFATGYPLLFNYSDPLLVAQWMYASFINVYHYTGSTKMSQTAATGVVNARGYVHGVRDLLVADATVLPDSPDGNTQGPAYIVGATIGEMLLAELQTPSSS